MNPKQNLENYIEKEIDRLIAYRDVEHYVYEVVDPNNREDDALYQFDANCDSDQNIGRNYLERYLDKDLGVEKLITKDSLKSKMVKKSIEYLKLTAVISSVWMGISLTEKDYDGFKLLVKPCIIAGGAVYSLKKELKSEVSHLLTKRHLVALNIYNELNQEVLDRDVNTQQNVYESQIYPANCVKCKFFNTDEFSREFLPCAVRPELESDCLDYQIDQNLSDTVQLDVFYEEGFGKGDIENEYDDYDTI